jgi:hypothetical protein
MALPPSRFEDIANGLFKYRYRVKIHVGTLVGGTPTNENVAEGWLRARMGGVTEERIKAEVAQVMADRGCSAEDAIEEVNRNRHLSGFRRNFNTELARADQHRAMTTGFVFAGERKIFTEAEAKRTFGELLIEARTIKAMLKEALMVAVGAGHIDATKWGRTSKAAKGFFAEHAFIDEERVLLGVTEPSEVAESFVHTFRGSGIKHEERLHDAIVEFTIIADWDFDKKVKDFWGILFSMAERQGLGASRSQGYGRFSTVEFEQVESDPETTRRATARAKELLELERTEPEATPEG